MRHRKKVDEECFGRNYSLVNRKGQLEDFPCSLRVRIAYVDVIAIHERQDDLEHCVGFAWVEEALADLGETEERSSYVPVRRRQ